MNENRVQSENINALYFSCRFSRLCVAFCEISWSCMAFLWSCIAFYGFFMVLYGILWLFMVLYGRFWSFIAF